MKPLLVFLLSCAAVLSQTIPTPMPGEPIRQAKPSCGGSTITSNCSVTADSSGAVSVPTAVLAGPSPNGSAPYWFLGANANSGDDSAILIGRALTGNLGSLGAHAFRDESTYSYSGATTGLRSYASFDAIPIVSGSAVFGHLAGFQARPNFNGSGSITNMYGFNTGPAVSSGTVDQLRHFYIQDAIGAGTLTSQVGIYVEALAKGASNYAIYTVGPTQSVFGGLVNTYAGIANTGNVKTTTLSVGLATATSGSPLTVRATANYDGTSLENPSGVNIWKASYDPTNGGYMRLLDNAGVVKVFLDGAGSVNSYIAGGNFGLGGAFITGAPAQKLTVAGSAIVYDTGTLGSELATSDASCTGWTLNAGWACASGVITHTSGTATATYTPTITAGWLLRATFTTTGRSAGSVTPSVGGVAGAAISTNAAQAVNIATTGTGNLIFTPTTDFNGSINVQTLSLKQIIGGYLQAASLAGDAVGYACVSATGKITRSATACVP